MSCGFCSFAQDAISSTGGHFKSSGDSTSFTVGQVAYVLKKGNDSYLNEGVQQVYTKKTTPNEELVHLKDVHLYPTPTPVQNKVTDIDGNQYEMIIIGNKIWMKENLKVSKYRNGEAILTGLDNSAWANIFFAKTKMGASAIFYNNNANDAIYGKLYNWYAVADNRGLCPSGWRVPTNDEWTTLINYLGGKSVAGGKMKSLGTAYWESPNKDATNESGFSALPGGYRDGKGLSTRIRSVASFWSSTEVREESPFAWGCELFSYSANVYSVEAEKTRGASVRCISN